MLSRYHPSKRVKSLDPLLSPLLVQLPNFHFDKPNTPAPPPALVTAKDISSLFSKVTEHIVDINGFHSKLHPLCDCIEKLRPIAASTAEPAIVRFQSTYKKDKKAWIKRSFDSKDLASLSLGECLAVSPLNAARLTTTTAKDAEGKIRTADVAGNEWPQIQKGLGNSAANLTLCFNPEPLDLTNPLIYDDIRCLRTSQANDVLESSLRLSLDESFVPLTRNNRSSVSFMLDASPIPDKEGRKKTHTELKQSRCRWCLEGGSFGPSTQISIVWFLFSPETGAILRELCCKMTKDFDPQIHAPTTHQLVDFLRAGSSKV